MNSQNQTDITAIVLAGGEGSRMGNKDKAWMTHHGRPLITHVMDRVGPQVDRIVISRNRDHPGYDGLSVECFADAGESLGPLSGILACRSAVTTPLSLIVPCDVPELPADIASQLSLALDSHDLAVARDSEQLQTLVFLARTSTLDSITGYLARGNRSVKGWIRETDHTTVCFDTQVFENINETGQLR